MDVNIRASLCAFCAVSVHGCGSSEDRPAPSSGGAGDSGVGGVAGVGGIGGTSGSGSAGGVGGTGGDAGGCPPKADPPGVPPGWEPYTGYSCACRQWVPSKGTVVDPVQWEPCPTPGPSNPTCKRMATPWTKQKNLSLTVFPRFWFDKSAGKAYLQFSRVFFGDDKNVRYRIVADLDGPVSNAFLQLNVANQGCEMFDKGASDGRYVFGVHGDKWTGSILGGKEGYIAGTLSSLPSLVGKVDMGPLSADWRVSKNWLVRWHSKVTARSWTSPEEYVVYDPAQDPEGMPPHGVQAHGDAVFWEVGVAGYSGEMSWTLAEGPRPLIRWPGDYTQGAGNFNTDGTDMVWTHGEGKPATSQQDYPKCSIMTAPFTTDPAVVKAKAKRLRSDPGQLAVEPFGIGCGHAGRVIYVPAADGGADTNALLIVRLSDGVSWQVNGPPYDSGMHFATVLGFSCDEVFSKVQFPDDASTVVRIRLDSLGPGTPPD